MEASEFTALTLAHMPGVSEGSLTLTALIDRSGSGRQFARYSRGSGTEGIVAMHYSLDRPENGRFVAITEYLRRQGLPVPVLHHWLEDKQVIWLEDLGPQDLVHFQHADWDTIRRPLYESALEAIFPLHRIHENDPGPDKLPGLEAPFDAALYRWEQEYFFEHFAGKFSTCPGDELNTIHKGGELQALAAGLAEMSRSLIHRDFQSSNIMIRDGSPWLIDYQGMRFGLPEYDLASLLYDPYVELGSDQREELVRYYFGLKQAAGDPESFEKFRERLDRCAAQRLMQALGAYGNLGLNKNQPEFLRFIPTALARLREVAVDRRAVPSLGPVLSLKETRVA